MSLPRRLWPAGLVVLLAMLGARPVAGFDSEARIREGRRFNHC